MKWNCERQHRANCCKYLGPILPRTYEQVRVWLKNRPSLRIGFKTLIRVATGTSYVHAFEIVHEGKRVSTLGVSQNED